MRNQPATTEGAISGMVTSLKLRTQLAPEIRDASSREGWIWLMAETTVRIPISRYLMR